MTWFKNLVAGAGLGHFTPNIVAFAMAASALFLGLVTVALVPVGGLGIATTVLVMAAQVELLVIRARVRELAVLRVFPEVIESVHSAVISGLDLNTAFYDLSRIGPSSVRMSFSRLSQALDSGVPLPEALHWLKREFGNAQVDQFAEYLALSQHSGGVTLAENLKSLAIRIRQDSTLRQEISAKQGWVIGTAKLALATPWLIVAILSLRSENAASYNSPGGFLVLGTAVALCLLAYLAVNLMSGLPQIRRVQQA